ncbi:MAG TPA: glucosyl-3-phosphoglycerate synthase [Solirubrobacteraceae bacterium]|jgi:glucosyl-3-phosphoglycerate synthase|nr:glucosyl-3-phosphoglycerate synthase [Solirubrobacteraceae bacterium]
MAEAELRTFHHSRYPAERIAAERELTVSVCVPTRECAGTIGAVVEALAGLREAGAIDEVLVIDAGSADGTAEIAEGAGAQVHQEAELMPELPELGPVLGKGDAMWRALSVARGEVICFVDGDSEEFSAHFACGLIGPLVCEPQPDEAGGSDTRSAQRVELVKGFYRRPFRSGGVTLPEGGGRVNHLTARPALALFYPELAAVRQPLAGEVAARRGLLERIPFATGFGVEIAMLIDAWREVGLGGLAQVDLEVHHNRHRPLAELTEMAETVLATIARRMEAEGRLSGVPEREGPASGAGEAPLERPPFASLGVAGAPR